MLDLHGQLHDGRNDIVLALLQCFHGLGTRHAGLGHHQIDVLGLDAFLVHFSFLFLRFLFFRLGGCRFLVGRFHGTTESLGCLRLSLSGQVFDLSFTKDDVGVRGRALEHIGFVDHKQDVLGLPDGHTHHARDRFHPQLLHGFPALFFATALLSASFFFTCNDEFPCEESANLSTTSCTGSGPHVSRVDPFVFLPSRTRMSFVATQRNAPSCTSSSELTSSTCSSTSTSSGCGVGGVATHVNRLLRPSAPFLPSCHAS
mmetsp:Transcript_5522/g.34165  ORF Transcript_5522/g.34165 Transcript_5522/m.34165 type:complete len:258 (-) Transcript_5522:325-1098(-)